MIQLLKHGSYLRNCIIDGVILETLRTVPDSLRSGCSHVKMDLKSVLANSQNEPCLSKISACTKKLAFARVQKKTAIYTCYPQKTLEDHNARSEAKINNTCYPIAYIQHYLFDLRFKIEVPTSHISYDNIETSL